MPVVTGTVSNDVITPAGISSGVTGGVPGLGNDTISGLEGNDSLEGGAGENLILGGAGNDTVVIGGSANETLDGGTGTDRIVYGGRNFVLLDLGDNSGDSVAGFFSNDQISTTLLSFENGQGGTGNDTIKGTLDGNILAGDAGADQIDGRGGSDLADYSVSGTRDMLHGVIVNLSSSAVTLDGRVVAAGTAWDNWGDIDTLSGIEGAIGSSFSDTLIGRTANPSRLEGGEGNDSLVGGNSINTIRGGSGDDTVVAGGFTESLYGDTGIDTVIYRGGENVTIDLGLSPGIDGYVGFLSGDFGETTLLSFERAYGGIGRETIRGNFDDNILSGDSGADLLDGRGGDKDIVDYGTAAVSTITEGVVVNLSAGTVTVGSVTLAPNRARDSWGFIDTLVSIEGIYGTAFGDTVIGSNSGNEITGGGGADSLNASGGHDTIAGDAGADTLRGGDGDDSVSAGAGNDAIVAGAGRDTVDGGGADERNSIDYRSGSFYFGGALTLVFTGPNTATVTKTDGEDTLVNINQFFGSGQADRFDFSNAVVADPYPFIVRGGQGNDTIKGNGSDRIIADYNDATAALVIDLGDGTVSGGGTAGNDSLEGIRAVVSSNGHADTLIGSALDDAFFIAGDGSKSVSGGEGTDTWRYQGGAWITVNLHTMRATHNGFTDVLDSIERAYGGNGNDRVIGSFNNDTLAGDRGNDTIDGGAAANGAPAGTSDGDMDVVDYSVFNTDPITQGVIVNLADTAETISGANIGGGRARDSWGGSDSIVGIEGVIGTGFADTIIGSNLANEITGGGGNDFLTGAGGNDLLLGGDGDDLLRGGDGDDLIDGGAGHDIALFTVASTTASWTRALTANGMTVTVTSGDGEDTLLDVETLRFTDRTVVLVPPAPVDLDGNATSDILWRHADGTLAAWIMQGTGGSTAVIGTVEASWSVAGIADFSGDRRADILWRATDGSVAQWQIDGATVTAGGTFAMVDPAWTIVGTADMNGDRYADILWRHADGTMSAWMMSGNTYLSGGNFATVTADWTVADLADFDGDGRADILWRSDAGSIAIWLMDGDRFLGGGTVATPGTAWQVAGTGDFSGDGKADILFQGANGEVQAWSMDGSTPLAATVIGNPGADCKVAAVGDYDGNLRPDILLQRADGALVMWLMDGTTIASQASLYNPGTDWVIQ